MDDTFVVGDPEEVAARVADPELWRRWWPGLDRHIHEDRGVLGHRWTLTGDFVGRGEVWLEPFGDGVIVHYFLWADPPRRGDRSQPDTTVRPRRAARLARAHTVAWKRRINALKDEFDAHRAPGEPRPAAVTAGRTRPPSETECEER